MAKHELHLKVTISNYDLEDSINIVSDKMAPAQLEWQFTDAFHIDDDGQYSRSDPEAVLRAVKAYKNEMPTRCPHCDSHDTIETDVEYTIHTEDPDGQGGPVREFICHQCAFSFWLSADNKE